MTYDVRTRELEIFGALKVMIEKLQTPSIPDFFEPIESGTNWEDPLYYVCVERNAVFIYFPSVQKTVTLGDKSNSFLTDAVIAYDFVKDNDNGDSFNRTLSKYGIAWKGDMWYDAFEQACQTIRDGKNLVGWTAPERPDYLNTNGMKQASQFDLNAFLNTIPEPTGDDDLGDYCPCCGVEFGPDDETCVHCTMEGEDKFCTNCGEEFVDGQCPECGDGVQENSLCGGCEDGDFPEDEEFPDDEYDGDPDGEDD